MTTTKRKSRILDEMHQTARGLHKTSLIGMRRIAEYDALHNTRIQDDDFKRMMVGECKLPLSKRKNEDI